MFNKTILVGNLTRDIELRYAQSGSAIANTAIATTRKFTQNGEKKEEVCFIDITFFGRSGEIANQYLRKGSKILVEGRIKLDTWVAQDGSKRSKHSVIVETMQMLDSKPADGQSNSHTNHNVNRGNGAPQQNAYDNNGNANPSYDPNPKQGADNYSYGGRNHNAPQQPNNVPTEYQDRNGNTTQRPPSNQVPVIDVDEDEIPF